MIRIHIVLSIAILGLVLIHSQSCKKIEEVQNNLLESSLNLLGEKLFSLLGEGENKELLRAKYNDFVSRAVQGEAGQDQIEAVAANILNASNTRDSIPAELAENIVSIADQSPGKPGYHNRSSVESLSLDKRSEIGENLKEVLNLNERIREKYKQSDFGEKVFYKYDKGLVLNIDEDLKQFMSDEEFAGYVEGMKEANKALRMEWKIDLQEQLNAERKALSAEMKKLREMDWSKYEPDASKKWMDFAKMDSNFLPAGIPGVDLDSIMQDVQLQLRKAGVREY